LIAIAELNGISKTITATPASTEGPKVLIERKKLSCCTQVLLFPMVSIKATVLYRN